MKTLNRSLQRFYVFLNTSLCALLMSGAAQSAQAGDVVVYGATPAGVAAAIAASREGAEVLLIEELSRVGGMWTVGGMGLSDSFFMDRQMIDGLYEEIHGRVDRHYRGLGIYYRPDNHGDIFP